MNGSSNIGSSTGNRWSSNNNSSYAKGSRIIVLDLGGAAIRPIVTLAMRKGAVIVLALGGAVIRLIAVPDSEGAVALVAGGAVIMNRVSSEAPCGQMNRGAGYIGDATLNINYDGRVPTSFMSVSTYTPLFQLDKLGGMTGGVPGCS